MQVTLDTTRSFATSGGAAAAAPERGAQLVCALDCANPFAPPGRFSLHGCDVVHLGRGNARSAMRNGRELRIEIPDSWMSTAHVRIAWDGATWRLRDLDSKNGTWVDGRRARKLALVDNDVIAVGRTLWVFRSDALGGDLDGAAWVGSPAALATLNGDLAHRLAQLTTVASTQVPVLVGGPTGTGKELTARVVHDLSGRTGKFVAVNCGALRPDLLEAELFGVRRGAFSGAVANRPGIVRTADGGTLFLDEIAALPMAAQSSLLRVLQEREVRPLGDTTAYPVDVRFVAATHENLASRVSAGAFRADLYGRISGHRIELPPLSKRREDIGLLVASALGDEHRDAELLRATGSALFHYRWPMNIRELVNAVRAAAALADGAPFAPEHFPPAIGYARPRTRPRPRNAPVTREQLTTSLADHAGNISAVARELGIARVHVRRLAARFDVHIASFR